MPRARLSCRSKGKHITGYGTDATTIYSAFFLLFILFLHKSKGQQQAKRSKLSLKYKFCDLLTRCAYLYIAWNTNGLREEILGALSDEEKKDPGFLHFMYLFDELLPCLFTYLARIKYEEEEGIEQAHFRMLRACWVLNASVVAKCLLMNVAYVPHIYITMSDIVASFGHVRKRLAC